jgi:hypothetical protein
VLRVLQITAYSPTTPFSLKAAYRLIHANRKTVWKHYHDRVRSSSDIRLEDLHEAIGIVRCISWKTPRNGWSDVLARSHCSAAWFRRALARQLGFTRDQLDDLRIEEIQLRWLPEVLDSVFRAQVSGVEVVETVRTNLVS